MAAKQAEKRVWNINEEEKKLFVPAIPVNDMDLNHVISPRAAFKVVQVVEYANLIYMFAGFERLLDQAGLTFEDFGCGETILFINSKRTYLKMLVGNGTDNPVIVAYRFPRGHHLPLRATREVVRSLLKNGHLQMDDRLQVAVTESVREMREAVGQTD